MSKRKRQRRRSAPVSVAAAPLVRSPSIGWPPRILLALGLVLLATVLAYLPAMSGGLLWDDEAHVTKPVLRSLTGLYRIWLELGATQQYYPLLHSAFWIEHKLWGDSVVGYHVTNLVQHLVAAFLVFLILRKLGIPGALLATAIFALHPVHVESVAWITEQKNTLSAIFYLGAMLAYLRFDESRERSYYGIAIALFVLGLLAKTVIATLPAALLVIFWWQRGKLDWKRDGLPLVPFFLLGAAAGVLTAWVEHTLIGANGADFELTFLQRGLVAGRVIWFYLGKLFWPTNLVFIYPRWHIDPAVWWQWLFPLATLGAMFGLWIVRGRWRYPLACWLFFSGTLLPVLGFLNVYPFLFSYVADHFQYLASLGMIVLVAATLTIGIGRLPAQFRWAGQTGCVLLVATLALLTWQQSRSYSDIVTLYQTTLDRNPECWMAHNNYGNYLRNSGKYQEALDHYRAAIDVKPDYADTRNDLGVALGDLGRYDDAIKEYQEALRLRPKFMEAENNWGTALVQLGYYVDAIRHFQQALEIRTDSPNAHDNLGNALRLIGRLREAIDEHREALRLQPDFAEAHNGLGIALFAVGEREEAMKHFHQALQLKPDLADAHNNLGNAFEVLGRYPEAIPEFERALALKPKSVQAENNLGDSLRLSGQPAEAIVHYEKGLELRPNSPAILHRLALCYAQTNQPAEAIAAAEKALPMARAAGDRALTQEVETWLSTYRAKQSTAPDQKGGSAQ
jgi:protein O-mannosyl-transferase